MNAKFEKWCHHERDLGHFIDMAKCGDGSYLSSRTFELNELWNAATKDALQSLEVTPELNMLAYASLIRSTGRLENGLVDPLPEDMEYVLTAVFNAIKEQAK